MTDRLFFGFLILLVLAATSPQVLAQGQDQIQFDAKQVFESKESVKAPAQQEFGAPADPSNGPTEVYIYRDDDGIFALGPNELGGVAKYRWKDKDGHKDVLRLMAFGQVNDLTGIGLPKGQVYDVWVYEASDKDGNVWYLAFGVDPLPTSNKGSYGLYYCRQDPTNGGILQRWLTKSGTRRE